MAIAVHIAVPGFTAADYAALLEMLQPKLVAAPGLLATLGPRSPRA